MKLLRHGPRGHEKPAAVDAQGRVRDLSHLIGDITPRHLSPESLAALRAVDLDSLPIVDAGRPGVPWTDIGKFIAIGLNFVDHAKETGSPIPEHPIVFFKSTTCIQGPNDPVMLPKDSTQSDWEVELGVVIGKRARYVEEKDALKHVAGYCVVNDLSEREFQLKKGGGQWGKGKGCDTFGPIGPWLVTADEVKDPQNLKMWLTVNGKTKQDGSTGTMIFGVAKLIADVSRYMTLEPGDVITTGTPPGVGMGQKPTPQYLKAGDVIELGIEGLGAQKQKVVAFKGKK